MVFNDLREWLNAANHINELVSVSGANCETEIGAIVDIYQEKMGRPALLFDDIPGFDAGYRVAANTLTSQARVALTLGLPVDSTAHDLIRFWRTYFAELRLLPPRSVNRGPVEQHAMTNDSIDLRRFPAPVWHECDGGPYIGTGSFVVMKDPDSDWINCGTYRVQVQGAREVSVYMSRGKHGRIIMEKHWKAGNPCPIAISCGHDPLLIMLGGAEVPYGVSEYDAIGGLRNEPVDVLRLPFTGLPVPATSELVIEGEIYPEDFVEEGPFGEFTGYATGVQRSPRVQVKSVLFRDSPIILGAIPGIPPNDDTYFGGFLRSALLWDQLEKAGIPGISGVWAHEAGGGHYWFTIAIHQSYPGHAKQVGLAAQATHVGSYCNKYVVVVDDDIDPVDTDQVIWAMCSRVDPRDDVEILRNLRSTPLDPTAYPETSPNLNARLVIDACRPWNRRDSFPPVARVSPQLRREIIERYSGILPADYR